MTKVLIFGSACDDWQGNGDFSPDARVGQFQSGLRDAGFQVTAALVDRSGRFTPRRLQDGQVIRIPAHETAQRRLIARQAPDILLVCGWRNWLQRRASKLPMILDLFRPELLESDQPVSKSAVEDKVRAFCHASLVVCSTDYQRDYYMGWLLQAGIMPDQRALRTVYWSPVSPPAVENLNQRDCLSFSDCDTTQELQTPARDLDDEALNRCNPMSRPQIASSRRACELTAATSMLERLWRGIPVICSDRAELADVIAGWGAGWALQRPENLSCLLEQLRSQPGKLNEHGVCARALAECHFGLQRTLQPVIDFCRDPQAPERLFHHRLCGDYRATWQIVVGKMKHRAKPILRKLPLAYVAARQMYRAAGGAARLLRGRR